MCYTGDPVEAANVGLSPGGDRVKNCFHFFQVNTCTNLSVPVSPSCAKHPLGLLLNIPRSTFDRRRPDGCSKIITMIRMKIVITLVDIVLETIWSYFYSNEFCHSAGCYVLDILFLKGDMGSLMCAKGKQLSWYTRLTPEWLALICTSIFSTLLMPDSWI